MTVEEIVAELAYQERRLAEDQVSGVESHRLCLAEALFARFANDADHARNDVLNAPQLAVEPALPAPAAWEWTTADEGNLRFLEYTPLRSGVSMLMMRRFRAAIAEIARLRAKEECCAACGEPLDPVCYECANDPNREPDTERDRG